MVDCWIRRVFEASDDTYMKNCLTLILTRQDVKVDAIIATDQK